jgi:hypothetical protein
MYGPQSRLSQRLTPVPGPQSHATAGTGLVGRQRGAAKLVRVADLT